MACLFGDRMCDQNGEASGTTKVSQINFSLSGGRKQATLLHRGLTVVDSHKHWSFPRFGSETYCKGISIVFASTDDHSASYPSNSDSHSWHSSCRLQV
jgi:hypothetical protein